MNTHDIELPPLPNMSTGALKSAFEEYARVAIEADRKRKGEVVVTKTPEGEIVAVTRQDDEGRILSVIAEADSKRRGEPVKVPHDLRNAVCDLVSTWRKQQSEYPAEGELAAAAVRLCANELEDLLARHGQTTAGTELAVPSDESLEKAWDCFEAEMARRPTDDELEEFMAQFADEHGHIADDRHAEAARAVLSRYGSGQHAASAEPVAADIDVRKIMLRVVPGDDGMGHEVYAKSVDEVESLLGEMGEELEDWRLGIRRFASAVPVAQEPSWQHRIRAMPDGKWGDQAKANLNMENYCERN